MKLKMWVGNLDGTRQGLVISSSKEKARKIVNSSRTDFDDYWVENPVNQSLEVEVLYTRINDYSRKPIEWVRGRCPLPERSK